jgi:hypothetical protein
VGKVLAISPKARLAIDLRDTWQGRALATATGKTAAVLLSAPFFCTAGRVAKSGHIVANMVTRSGRVQKDFPVYRNIVEMQNDFRRLADALKFDDADRIQLFAAVKNWVVADRRLDPTMDPKDPDAKRLIN